MSELSQLEDMICLYKKEADEKRKRILYLKLVEYSLKLVNKVVSLVYPIPVTVSRDDLSQVGAIGLLKAIETYEVHEKGSFKTYATIYIRGKILQYLRDKANIVKTPRENTENSNTIRNYINNLKPDENPSIKEIANALNIPENKVIDWFNIENTKNIISLDQKVYSTDGMETIADRIQSYDEKEYERNYENKKLIEYALGKLPQQERKSIYLYYIEGQTKKEISVELIVSQTQVARLIKRALVKMYNLIKEDNSSQGG